MMARRFAVRAVAIAWLSALPFAQAQEPDEPDEDEPALMSKVPTGTPSETPLPDARETLREIVKEPRYAFCHDPERSPRRERYWCHYASEQIPECAAFAAACKKLKAEAEDSSRTAFSLPPVLVWLAQILFWGALIAVAAWWLFKMTKNLFDESSDDEKAPDSLLPPLPQGEAEALPQADKDALRLLNGAKKAFGKGDDVNAARLGHAALIRALEAAGHLHVARTSTNGDYVRALGEKPDFRSVVKESSREVEKSEFGHEPPAHDGVERLLSRIEPIVRNAAALLAVLVSLAALSGLTGCSSSRGGITLPEDEPSGTSVLREFFVRRGATFERRTRPLAQLNDSGTTRENTDLVIVRSYESWEDEDWKPLLEWVRNGGHVMFLGVDAPTPKELGVKNHRSSHCDDVVKTKSGVIEGARVIATGWGMPLELSEEWTPIAECGGGALIAMRELDDGEVDVFVDEDFFTNASLTAGDHVRVLAELAGQPEAVSFVDQRFAAGAASPYNAIAKSGMTVLLAQGLLFMFVCALWRRAGFGPTKDVLPPPRHAFSEHVQAVARLYARAGASRHAFAAYAGWAIDRLNARLRPGATPNLIDLGATIAKTTGRKEGDVMRVLVEAADARDRPSMPSQRNDDLAALAALDDLVNETGGLK